MIDKLLSFIAPHLCCGCGKVSTLLCDNCKNDIVLESEDVCLVCKRPTGRRGVCNTCKEPYDRAWNIGERKDVLQRLIGLYKFERVKAAYRVLGDLLLETLPVLPTDTVVVPVPTVSSHIRERGYDHIHLLARYVAKKRGWRYQRLLERTTHTTQRHVGAKERKIQASRAFRVRGEVKDSSLLLIDDIVTTGATIHYGARMLKGAGAERVWTAVLAYQTLD